MTAPDRRPGPDGRTGGESRLRPRAESVDKATYRERNLVERVVGWYKECRALGTRYEKLGVDYVVLWMVAMIERLLSLDPKKVSG